jgi:hypothetical protein
MQPQKRPGPFARQAPRVTICMAARRAQGDINPVIWPAMLALLRGEGTSHIPFAPRRHVIRRAVVQPGRGDVERSLILRGLFAVKGAHIQREAARLRGAEETRIDQAAVPASPASGIRRWKSSLSRNKTSATFGKMFQMAASSPSSSARPKQRSK